MIDGVTLAVDAMSGDHGLKITVAAALFAVKKHANLHIILVGDQDLVRAQLAKEVKSLPRINAQHLAKISVHHASEVVEMDDLPSKALRNKKDSSLRVAINLVKEGRVQAAVSAGNTGVLMATAKYVLKTLPGIDRPALCGLLPSRKGSFYMLDLGANITCSAEQLLQFAQMASALASAMQNIERPKVALLNIGSEEMKGSEAIQEAAELLQKSTLNYTGFIESDAIFYRHADVVVCDGLLGNIALKSAEGSAKLMRDYIREEFTRNWLTKMAGLLVKPILNRVAHRLDPSHSNGANLLGLNGLVIKSHGSADAFSFSCAIDVALHEVEHQVLACMQSVCSSVQPVCHAASPLTE